MVDEQQQCVYLKVNNDTDWSPPANDTSTFFLPSITLDDSDRRTENIHTQDSEALLLILVLLFLTVVTIWVFRVNRFRILHETGLSMLYGKLYVVMSALMGNMLAARKVQINSTLTPPFLLRCCCGCSS